MDKYVELFCKQNPKMTLECNNPDCKQKTTVNSKDVFKRLSFTLLCSKCNKETIYDTSKFADDFKKQLKKLGVTVK